jgi:Kef-type K+ transport system membrane component KefB
MTPVFLELSFAVGTAVIISFIMRALKQPLIIGYILTGIIVGPSILSFVGAESSLEVFASLGVAFLLFIVGLGLNPDMIKDVGKVSVITGIAQIIFTSVVGFFLGRFLGFSTLSAMYMAVGLTFSSTIIILRLLYEKEDQDKLYGRISIGFLLIQDLVAMLIFVFLSSTAAVSGNLLVTGFLVLAKLLVVSAGMYVAWKFILPKVDKMLSDSRQLQFIFAIALCFSMATLFQFLGFSLELGALVAGVLLSTSPFHRELASRIEPLRDFFLVIFFISLGSHMAFGSVVANIVPILLYSSFVLIGNPIIVLMIMTKLGHTRKTAFYSGLTVAQISEFSLILLGIGISVGHIPNEMLAIGTSVGLVTIALSSYMITYNEQIFNKLEPFLKFVTPFATDFEENEEIASETFELLILGAHRLGGGVIESAIEKKISFLVIEHDPRLVSSLKERGIPTLFGSVDDALFLDTLDFSKTKMVISTVADFNTNSLLLEYISKINEKIQVICLANHRSHAEMLYQKGAAYVVMPFYLSRRFVVQMFDEFRFAKSKYKSERKKHIKQLSYLEHFK